MHASVFARSEHDGRRRMLLFQPVGELEHVVRGRLAELHDDHLHPAGLVSPLREDLGTPLVSGLRFASLRACPSSDRRAAASSACARRYAKASPEVTASMRRTPEPTDAFGDDRERPDLRGRAHVGAAAELAREAGDFDHADDLAVLLPEEHHRTELPRLLDRRQERVHREVLEHPLVDDLLHALALLRAHRLRVGEVEAQLVGPHCRAGLAHVVAEDLLKRLVQEVCRRVVGHRREAHLPGDAGLDPLARGEPLSPEDERLVLAEAERGRELGALPVGLDPALVAHLPAPVGIEGRLPQLCEEGAVAEILEGADLREHLGLLPAEELRLEAGLAREVPSSLQLALLPSRPRDLAVLLHEPLEPVLVDRVPALARELLGQLDREAVRRRERECILGRDVSLGRDLVEELHPARKRLREPLFLRAKRFADRLPVRLELRIPLAHLLDDDVRKSPQVFEPDLPRLLDSAADDAPEDVAAALVRGHDAVGYEAGHPAPVVGEHAVRLRRHLVRVPGDAALLLDPGHDRLVAVGLVDRPGGHFLHDRGQPLEAHARVDVLLRKRRQRPVGLELVLHEDEVPELEEAVAARTRGRAAGIAAPVLLAPVEVDLRVGPARPRPADRPEVLAAREGDDPLARDADLAASGRRRPRPRRGRAADRRRARSPRRAPSRAPGGPG